MEYIEGYLWTIVIASSDASSKNEEEPAPGTLEGGAEERREVAKSSKPWRSKPPSREAQQRDRWRDNQIYTWLEKKKKRHSCSWTPQSPPPQVQVGEAAQLHNQPVRMRWNCLFRLIRRCIGWNGGRFNGDQWSYSWGATPAITSLVWCVEQPPIHLPCAYLAFVTSVLVDSSLCYIWTSDLLVDFGLIPWTGPEFWTLQSFALPLALNMVSLCLNIAGLNRTLPQVWVGTWGIHIKGLDY